VTGSLQGESSYDRKEYAVKLFNIFFDEHKGGEKGPKDAAGCGMKKDGMRKNSRAETLKPQSVYTGEGIKKVNALRELA